MNTNADQLAQFISNAMATDIATGALFTTSIKSLKYILQPIAQYINQDDYLDILTQVFSIMHRTCAHIVDHRQILNKITVATHAKDTQKLLSIVTHFTLPNFYTMILDEVRELCLMVQKDIDKSNKSWWYNIKVKFGAIDVLLVASKQLKVIIDDIGNYLDQAKQRYQYDLPDNIHDEIFTKLDDIGNYIGQTNKMFGLFNELLWEKF